MIVNWNLTRSGRRARDPEVVVLSVGKSGRTWLRVLVNKVFSLHFGSEFHLGDMHEGDERIPSILYTHEAWEYYSKGGVLDRLRGKYLVPDRLLARKRVVVLYRDPRDVVVSLYFQKTKRSRDRVDVTMDRFIRDPDQGVRRIVQVMNLWRRRLRGHPRCAWVSYEALHSDTVAELRRLLPFLGVEGVEDHVLEEAVAFSRFENMHRMEASGEFRSEILRPGDPSDPDSFKVREGKVGGYVRHFDAEDLAYVDRAVAALDPAYGYAETR